MISALFSVKSLLEPVALQFVFHDMLLRTSKNEPPKLEGHSTPLELILFLPVSLAQDVGDM